MRKLHTVTEEEPKAREEYLDKLERIRKQKAISIGNLEGFKKRYGSG
ncbi:MAG TPA: hypothetical protein VJ461_02955 [Candidatus Nanoarchaeia archaeon]|nr:hypothetical protein [Candidatus Nanoarchaeia archaeon]